MKYHYVADIDKYSEGGVSQAYVKFEAALLGIRVKFERSPYVGLTTMLADTQDKRRLYKLAKNVGLWRNL